MAARAHLGKAGDRGIDGIAAARALFDALAHAREERLAFAYLDPEWSISGMRFVTGGPDAIDVPVRTVAADAIAFDAVAVVMAHNHPSGLAEPSDADIAATRRLYHALAALDVRLADHLILAGGACTSFRERGLL